MSRFSEFLHHHFGTTRQQSAIEQILQIAGEVTPEIEDFAKSVIGALDGTDFSNTDRKAIAVKLIAAVTAHFGVTIPGWLVNMLVDELVGQARKAEEAQGLQ